MAQIANYINSYSDNTAYSADQSKDYPNISYIQGTDEVKWNKYDPDHIVCVYNVTSTSEATKLLLSTRNISKMWIDGVEQPSVVDSYTFVTTGEHIVKIGLSDKTTSRGCSFRQCNNIISAITPSNISLVYSYCFAQCNNLVSIIIQNGVTGIDNNAFYKDTRLTNVTIPKSVTIIGNECFYGCTGLTSITIEATTPPTLRDIYALDNTNNCPIYVPAESVDTYKAATNWSTYASRIQAIPTT